MIWIERAHCGEGWDGPLASKFHLILVRPRKPDLLFLRNSKTGWVFDPLTSTFVCARQKWDCVWPKEGLEGGWEEESYLVHNFERDAKVLLAILNDLFIGTWLLATKLITREAHYLKAWLTQISSQPRSKCLLCVCVCDVKVCLPLAWYVL